MMTTDAQERKDTPVYSGFMCYFPDAIAEVARLSKAGNDQHNPGEPLHWDRSKSGDELDALTRHLLDRANAAEGGIRSRILHQRAIAWRAMADLQKLCEELEGVENSNSQKSARRAWAYPITDADRMTIRRNIDSERPLNYGTTLPIRVAENYVRYLRRTQEV